MNNRFKSILEPIAELLTKKRNDYGDNYEQGRDKRGPVRFYLRIEDELNRIERLDSNSAQVKTESAEDSLSDIIGYCVLEINYRREERIKLGTATVIEVDNRRIKVRCGTGLCSNYHIKNTMDVDDCPRISFSMCKWKVNTGREDAPNANG